MAAGPEQKGLLFILYSHTAKPGDAHIPKSGQNPWTPAASGILLDEFTTTFACDSETDTGYFRDSCIEVIKNFRGIVNAN